MKKTFPESIRKPELEVESFNDKLRGFVFEGRDGSQIVFWECEEEVKVESHSHEYDEYCVVVEGVCKETIENETFELKSGDELFIPAGKTHWAIMGPNYRAIDFFGGKRVSYKHNKK